MIAPVLRLLRRRLTGGADDFTFRPASVPELPELEACDLYIHIPFCRNRCRYCPYNTVPYRPEQTAAFFQALRRELRLYLPWLQRRRIGSIYIGGGTPTVVWPELEAFLAGLFKRLPRHGPVALETNPDEIDDALVSRLRSSGVSLVSLGVQSFDDGQLRFLGRSYPAEILPDKIARLQAGGFAGVNLDLMFAFGAAPERIFAEDLAKAMASGVAQITAYPLFEFPYSQVGEIRRQRHLKMPKLRLRRRLYELLFNTMTGAGWQPRSVWGFSRTAAPAYSSVTRDFFLGLGPGAASRLPNRFYFNTFDNRAYQQRLAERRFPTALGMTLSERLSNWYWLYWRFYETWLPVAEIERRFAAEWAWPPLRKSLDVLHWWEPDGEMRRLTLEGAFWIHLLQNGYILNDIDQVWSSCRREAFPAAIRL